MSPTKMEIDYKNKQNADKQAQSRVRVELAGEESEKIRKLYPTYRSKYEDVKPPRFLPLHFNAHTTVEIMRGMLSKIEVCVVCGKVWRIDLILTSEHQ